MSSCDVLLIAMPWAQFEYPSIQLGILKAVLDRSGIQAETRSSYFIFVEHLVSSTSGLHEDDRITLADYSEIASRRFLGDWIFAVPPFHDSQGLDEQYFSYLRERNTPESVIRKAVLMRRQVPLFLQGCLEDILAAAPTVVGFTTTFCQNVPSLVLAKLLKSRDPSIRIVFGGANCDGPMGAALHRSFPWVDVVVRGEGERVVGEVFHDLLAHRPIRSQPGLCFRQEDQVFVVDQSSAGLVSMEEVPMPDYDEYFDRIQHSPLSQRMSQDVSLPFETARGCWWGAKAHCTFCGLNGSAMAFRSKNASCAAEEVITLARKYGRLSFQAVDNIIDMRYFDGFLPKLRASGFDFQLFYETKSNLKKEQIRAMRDAGVTSIQPGIESLSTPILRLMKKGVTTIQNIRTLKWCAELGIQVFWNVIYGFPGEPSVEYGRIAETIKSLTHLEPPSLIPLDVQRFSPYFERAESLGLKVVGPLPHYHFIYPDGTFLDDLAYSFEYRYLDDRDPETYVQPVREAIAAWQSSYPAGVGSLQYRRGPGFLILQDRRPGLEPCEFRMGEREAEIYLACEGGSTPEGIARLLETEGQGWLDPQEIRDFLTELREARLVYEEDDLYLCLALPVQRTRKATADIVYDQAPVANVVLPGAHAQGGSPSI